MKTALAVLTLVFSLVLNAQTTPASSPSSTSGAGAGIWNALTDPDYISTAAAAAAAVSNTAVQVTIAGKTYSISPQQQLWVELGAIGSTAVIRHFYGDAHPRLAKILNVGLSLGAVWLGSRAYANTYYKAATPVASPSTPSAQAAIFRVRR